MQPGPEADLRPTDGGSASGSYTGSNKASNPGSDTSADSWLTFTTTGFW